MAKHEHQYSMITLREYRDQAESFGMSSELDDRLDWYVSGHAQNRDSDALARSNFRTAVRLLTENGIKHEIVRFGHWLCGWVEHILISPEGREYGEHIECDDYPVLDESDFSELECEDEWESWESWGRNDFQRALVRDFRCERVVDLLSADDIRELYQAACHAQNHDPHEADYSDTDGVTEALIVKLALYRRLDNRARKLGLQAYDGTHLRRTAVVVLSPATYECTYSEDDLTAPGVCVFESLKSARKALRALEGK